MREDCASVSLKYIFFFLMQSLSLIFFNNVSTETIDPVNGDADLFAQRFFRDINEVSSSVSPAERAASAKIERFEAQAIRKVCNGERRARRVRWTFYVDENMTKAMTHGWAVGYTFVHSPRVASDANRNLRLASYGYLPLIFAPYKHRKMCAERK